MRKSRSTSVAPQRFQFCGLKFYRTSYLAQITTGPQAYEWRHFQASQVLQEIYKIRWRSPRLEERLRVKASQRAWKPGSTKKRSELQNTSETFASDQHPPRARSESQQRGGLAGSSAWAEFLSLPLTPRPWSPRQPQGSHHHRKKKEVCGCFLSWSLEFIFLWLKQSRKWWFISWNIRNSQALHVKSYNRLL